VQTGDARHHSIAAVPELRGLEGGEPAALLLVKAAAQEIHLMVELLLGVVRTRPTIGALALMHIASGHTRSSVHYPRGANVSIQKNSK
jgi:hypothetical protein